MTEPKTDVLGRVAQRVDDDGFPYRAIVVLTLPDGKCGCCLGSGEHECAHECGSCDGSGRNPDDHACRLPHGADCKCTSAQRVDRLLAAARAEGVREGREWAIAQLRDVDRFVDWAFKNPPNTAVLLSVVCADYLAALAPNTEETERRG